jgi:hypothetical protein
VTVEDEPKAEDRFPAIQEPLQTNWHYAAHTTFMNTFASMGYIQTDILYTVVKAGEIFLLPRIFPSYIMNIV